MTFNTVNPFSWSMGREVVDFNTVNPPLVGVRGREVHEFGHCTHPLVEVRVKSVNFNTVKPLSGRKGL